MKANVEMGEKGTELGGWTPSSSSHYRSRGVPFDERMDSIPHFPYMDPPPFARRCVCDFAVIKIASIYSACC